MKNVGFNIPVVVAHRKQEILGAPDLLVGSGKRYYVSETGNDTNDGLSPESAWATLEHVNRANHLRTGDMVLFQTRGFVPRHLQTKVALGTEPMAPARSHAFVDRYGMLLNCIGKPRIFFTSIVVRVSMTGMRGS